MTEPMERPIIYIAVGCACGVALLITFAFLVLCIIAWYVSYRVEPPNKGRSYFVLYRILSSEVRAVGIWGLAL